MDELVYDDERLREILEHVHSIAVVGLSPKTNRPSYQVAEYMIAKGYDVIPVNPGHAGEEILGKTVYGSLTQVPGSIDMVDIFRNSEAAGHVTDAAINLAPEKGIRVIWMQLGVRNDAAAHRAEEAGITVIMDRCPKIEYPRLMG